MHYKWGQLACTTSKISYACNSLTVKCVVLLIWIVNAYKNNTLFLFGGESVQEYLNMSMIPTRSASSKHLSTTFEVRNYVLSTATTFLVQQPRFQYDLNQSYLRTGRTGWIFKHAWRSGTPFPSMPVHSVLNQTVLRLYIVHCVSTAFLLRFNPFCYTFKNVVRTCLV